MRVERLVVLAVRAEEVFPVQQDLVGEHLVVAVLGRLEAHEVQLVPAAGAVFALFLVGEREGVHFLGGLEAEVVAHGLLELVQGDRLVGVDQLLDGGQ